MNELSIAEMGNKLGIDEVLTQQSINLIVDYGLNLIAGIVTLAIGIWLSRKAGLTTRNWLNRIDRLDPTLVPMLGALVFSRCMPGPILRSARDAVAILTASMNLAETSASPPMRCRCWWMPTVW